MTSIQIFLILAIVLSLALDFWLINWLKRLQKQRGIEPAQAGPVVTLFGTYSPVLTWLKYRRLPRLEAVKAKKPAPEAKAVELVELPAEKVGARQAWLECAIIGAVVVIFCWGILDLNAQTHLVGNEGEFFQILDTVLVNSLRNFHQFPLWNPYNLTGLPYIADPMLHLYNPVVTLPVLLFGVHAGFKLGIFLSYLLAAWGMWWLGATLGMGRPARLWVACMYAFAGQPAARFFQGEYLFVLGFAWIPWIIASLIQVSRTRRRKYVALTVIFLGLLFFCGNAYYQFIMLLAGALFGLVMALRRRDRFPYVRLDLGLVKIYGVIAVLALGLVAIQLLPSIELYPHLSKDMTLSGSHTLYQIFLDYTSKDISRPDAFNVLPAREEFYAYIGYTPFIGLLLLPLAFWKGDRRLLIFFLLLLVLAVTWISLDYMPWREAFMQTKFLLQFRHLLRALLFGSLALIVLAGLGLDRLWKSLVRRRAQPATEGAKKPFNLAAMGMTVLCLFMLAGAMDVFSTNRPILRTDENFQPAYSILSWLRQYDLSDYYITHQPANAWYDATVAYSFRYIHEWFPYVDLRDTTDAQNKRPVEAQPLYLIQSSSDPTPDIPSLSLVRQIEDFNVFKVNESLPMAFVVNNATLAATDNPNPLQRSEVQVETPFFPGQNGVEVIAQGAQAQSLVVLSTLYPGWNVAVDGQAAALKNIGGYMGVDVLPGVHRYTFSFRPWSFFAGLFISLIFTLLTFFLLVTDIKPDWQALRRQWQVGLVAAGRVKRIPAGWLKQPGITAEAIYAGGVLQPVAPIALPEASRVRISIEEATLQPRPALRRWVWSTASLADAIVHAIPLEAALCSVALVVYLSTRLIGLTAFPMYFFTDEAVQTVMAADFLRDDFKNYNGEQWPTYFNIDPTYNLSSVSVYLQVIPFLLFGKSVFVTRAVSVLVATFAAVMVGLLLRNVFKLPFWWGGVMLLSIAPAWFLHSRTAFEPVEMISFYAGFLYFYLLYRFKSPRYLYVALVMGTLSFYTYSPGLMLVVLTGLGLLISDFRYHWENRQVGLKGLLLIGLMVLPFLRYMEAHPNALMQGLVTRAPFWIAPGTVSSKIGRFFLDYAQGFDLRYWFLPNDLDLVRHLMKGYGHLLWWTFPFFALGLVLAVKNFRSPAYRAILIALLASPVGGALAGIGITRVLVFVIPATILTAIGLNLVLTWVEKLIPRKPLSLAVLGLLVVFNLGMLRDALVNGPTWFQDYTMGGMQYAAVPVFGAIKDYLAKNPDKSLIVSPAWANGTEELARFFLPDPMPIKMGTVDDYMFQDLPLDSHMVFVMIPDEYGRAVASRKFKTIQVIQTLPYPNEKPGFYFATLSYVDQLDQILETEKEARRQLLEADVTIDGKPAKVKYSRLDMGDIHDIWDGDANTLARTLEANPFVIDITFSEPRYLTGLSMVVGDTNVQIDAKLYAAAGTDPTTFTSKLKGSVANPKVSMDFGKSVPVEELHLEVTSLNDGEPGHVHIWEIYLR